MAEVTVHHGDSRDVLKTLADASIDSVVTDPPYALVSIGKRFGKPGSAPAKSDGASGVYARASAGFMGQAWDTGETAFAVEFWAEVYRVLKPGGHVVAFSGTRTYHRMACAIEDAGFEIRDQLAWNFGSGFPKSHNIINKLRDSGRACRCPKTILSHHHVRDENLHDLRQALEPQDSLSGGEERHLRLGLQGRVNQKKSVGETDESGAHDSLRDLRVDGSPAAVASCEKRGDLLQPVVPFEVVRGSLKADGGQHEGAKSSASVRSQEPGLEGGRHAQATKGELQGGSLCEGAGVGAPDGAEGWLHHGASTRDGTDVRLSADANGGGQSRGPESVEQLTEQPDALPDQRRSQAWGGWPVCPGCLQPVVPEGYGTALKPAFEPICLARKPLDGTVAANVLEHGTGALNIDACRVGTALRSRSRSTGEKISENLSMAGANYAREIVGEVAGRWPANIVHDGSDEVVESFPAEAGGGFGKRGGNANSTSYGFERGSMETVGFGDAGSAARFFYTAKADAVDRLGSKHPTVKPIDLMAWLCRLVTPPGGTILDPFAGSGTTGVAAYFEGFDAILVEREEAFVADINRRLAWARGEGRLTAQEMSARPIAVKLTGQPSIFGDDAPPPEIGTDCLRELRPRRRIGPVGLKR